MGTTTNAPQHPRQKTYVKEKIVTAQSSCTKLYTSHEPVLCKHNTDLTKNPPEDDEDEEEYHHEIQQIRQQTDQRKVHKKQVDSSVNQGSNSTWSSKNSPSGDFSSQLGKNKNKNNASNYASTQKRSLDSMQKSKQAKNADAILGVTKTAKPRYKSTITAATVGLQNRKSTQQLQQQQSALPVPMYVNAHQKMLARRLNKATNQGSNNYNPDDLSFNSPRGNQEPSSNYDNDANNNAGPNKNYSITDLVKNIAKINDYQKQREEDEKEQRQQLLESARALAETETLEDQCPPSRIREYPTDEDEMSGGNGNSNRNHRQYFEEKQDDTNNGDRVYELGNNVNRSHLPPPPTVFTDDAAGDRFQSGPGDYMDSLEPTDNGNHHHHDRRDNQIVLPPYESPGSNNKCQEPLAGKVTTNQDNFLNPIQQVYAFYTQHEPNCPAVSARHGKCTNTGSNYYFYGPATGGGSKPVCSNNFPHTAGNNSNPGIAIVSPEASKLLLPNDRSSASSTFPAYSYPQGQNSPRGGENNVPEDRNSPRSLYLPSNNLQSSCNNNHHDDSSRSNRKQSGQKSTPVYDPSFFENLGSWT